MSHNGARRYLQSVDDEPRLRRAINQVFADYGDVVSVEAKAKALLKFGRSLNIDSGTEGTVMTLPGDERHETFVSTNVIDTLTSSAEGDTSITFGIEGHTISGGDFTFVAQQATTDASGGRAKIVLSTPLARCTRIYTIGATAPTGAIYVSEDDTHTTPGVPDTDAKVHCMIRAGRSQSEKCATTLSALDYWFITEALCSVARGSAANAIVDYEIQWRTGTNVFRPIAEWSLDQGSANALPISFDPVLIIPKNADVRLVATSDTNDTFCTGNINGPLAAVMSTLA